MLSTLLIVLPVFALIFAGWLAGYRGMLGPAATSEINRFVVHLAMPALLFDIVAHARWAQMWQPGFIAAFGIAALAVFGGTVAVRVRGRPLADAAIDGLNAGYANTGFVGFPLVLAALGPAGLAPTLIASIVTICLLFALAIVLVEIGLQGERHVLKLARTVGLQLVRNPLLVAPVLGALVPLAALALPGIAIPGPAEVFLKLLGGAAPPCALVAVGLFLARARRPVSGAGWVVVVLVALKLMVQPALTWVLAVPVLHLPAALAEAAVLIAALPTGTGPFMLAEYYQREGEITSATVLVSTVLSVVTISLYLAWAR